jgi:hypothetical protein
LDLIAALSGFFISSALLWIAFLLLAALIVGGVIGGFFVSIFYTANRLAISAERAYAEKLKY